MNPVDLPLRAIHLPTDVHGWPPAPLWWIMAVLLLLALAWLIRRFVHQRQQQGKRQALAQRQQSVRDEVREVLQHYHHHHDAAAAAAAISALLRRVCLLYFPREDFAALHGEAWLSYLREQQPWPEARQRLLLHLPYQSQSTADEQEVRRLVQDAEDWMLAVIAHHD